MKTTSLTDLNSRARAIWVALLAEVDPMVVAQVAAIIGEYKAKFATEFYDEMLSNQESSPFLSHALVSDRLNGSLQKWMQELFMITDPAQIDSAIAHQRIIGEVHARIHLPLHLVSRGVNVLRHEINKCLAASDISRSALIQAADYVTRLTGVAIELMSSAYTRSNERSTRTEEAYRLFALGENIQVERERQRAMLMEWAHMTLSTLHRQPHSCLLPLESSEFGLWLNHKGKVIFDGASEIGLINKSIDIIDNNLLPAIMKMANNGESIATQKLIMSLDKEILTIRFHLSTLFDRHVEIEASRDTLTRLLNRRFIPIVLNREMELAKQSPNKQFAVLLIDLDNFKRLNDEYGHDMGDLALQHAASIINNSIRAGDFLFRYGGEEFLLVLTEVDNAIALKVAELIRWRLEATPLAVDATNSLTITASIGLATYDNYPDYQYLITTADKALYEAKRQGRNCVRAAPQITAAANTF